MLEESPQAEIVGREGMMSNEATIKNKDIQYQHFGVFSNTNSYSVTFNPFINRQPSQIMHWWFLWLLKIVKE